MNRTQLLLLIIFGICLSWPPGPMVPIISPRLLQRWRPPPRYFLDALTPEQRHQGFNEI